MPTEEICGFKSYGPTPWAVEVLGLPAGHGPQAPCGPPLSFQAVSPKELSDSPLFHSAVQIHELLLVLSKGKHETFYLFCPAGAWKTGETQGCSAVSPGEIFPFRDLR